MSNHITPKFIDMMSSQPQNLLDNIRIVLVRTFHSGNIGSAARAMKTMGISNLILVSPHDFQLNQALQMAVSADDVVTNAKHLDSLYEAVSDCVMVMASTARTRDFDLVAQTTEMMAESLIQHATTKQVALVFGPERTGLSNDDLIHCTHRVTIPTNPNYSSLNLASAVQALCYEIFKHYSSMNKLSIESNDAITLPSIEKLELFYQHLEEALVDIDFIFKKHPGDVMKKLRRLFTKAEMDQTELNIMRGILTAAQKSSLQIVKK